MLSALCGFQRAEDILLPYGHRATARKVCAADLVYMLPFSKLHPIRLRCYEPAGPCIYLLCMVMPMSVSQAFSFLQFLSCSENVDSSPERLSQM